MFVHQPITAQHLCWASDSTLPHRLPIHAPDYRMSEAIKAVVLGVIQGLTEFLPVSSSGHIELGKKLLDLTYTGDDGLLMTVVLHAATALSTVVVFRKEILEILRGLFAFRWNEEVAFTAKIILSMIPAVVIGLTCEDWIDGLFTGNLLLVGCMLLVTGVLLFLAGRSRDTDKPVGFGTALIVGISQAIAILPGISRSGATISTSVLCGIDRSKAAKFSFLMVVPPIAGKMAKDLLSGDLTSETAPVLSLGLGFVAAFLTGLVACKLMIALVKNCQLWWFSIYCFVVGAIAIVAA